MDKYTVQLVNVFDNSVLIHECVKGIDIAINKHVEFSTNMNNSKLYKSEVIEGWENDTKI